MLRLVNGVLLALCLAGGLAAQDCFIQLFKVATAPATASFDNSNPQCDNWTVMYTTQGFSAASIEFDSAPDANGTPGSFVAFAGTVVFGLNPSTIINTGTQGVIKFFGYEPWLRLNFQSKSGTGTITAVAIGYKAGAIVTLSSSSSGCPGTVGTPCVVVGPAAVGASPAGAPVEISALDSAGKLKLLDNCTLQLPFDVSASGNTLLVAASGSTQIRVCRLSIEDTTGTGGTNATNTEQLIQGTGATCAGGTTNLWMAYVQVAAAAEDFSLGPLVAAASNALCIKLTNATRVTGAVQYSQH
jgi:hypothetical protein